jgi:hypothetical protein
MESKAAMSRCMWAEARAWTATAMRQWHDTVGLPRLTQVQESGYGEGLGVGHYWARWVVLDEK